MDKNKKHQQIIDNLNSLSWLQTTSNKTLLSQGIPTALPKTQETSFAQRNRIFIDVILLEKLANKDHNVLASFSTIITRNMQITGKGEHFGLWLKKTDLLGF